jgi:transcriptional regulator with XRE-family HTH domain
MTKGMYYRDLIGTELKKTRLLHGLTQKELAEKLGVTVNYLSLLETGNRSPSFALLHKAATVFRCKLVFVFEDT